ncbi:MAG: hypothetical protein MJ096_02080 [Clostridia bacterium]|nr:hypothetical protein [Clostridia bacterium]
MKKDFLTGDRLIWEITRAMWFFLSVFAVYILYLAVGAVREPSVFLHAYGMIPRMTEHLLAGVVVTLACCVMLDRLTEKYK